MKALFRLLILLAVAFAAFAAFSGSSKQAFGSVGRPAPAPCSPLPPSAAQSFCAQ
jgi:hypothetical protein